MISKSCKVRPLQLSKNRVKASIEHSQSSLIVILIKESGENSVKIFNNSSPIFSSYLLSTVQLILSSLIVSKCLQFSNTDFMLPKPLGSIYVRKNLIFGQLFETA